MRDRHLRAGTLRTRVVARDEAVHRRDLEAADRAELGLALERMGDDLLRGEEPDEVAGLLLLEENAADVRGLALELSRDTAVVDDRELRLREALGNLRDRVGHQEADADHEPAPVPRSAGQVRDVVAAGLRDEDRAVDAELLLRNVETLVREEVERAVVETADVGHERDLVLCRRRLDVGLRGARAGAERQHKDRDQRHRCERHERTYFHLPSLEDTSTAKLRRLIRP